MGEGTAGAIWPEMRTLLCLAGPIMVGTMLAFLMNLVDMAMVGSLGTEELAAAALGNTFFNALNHPMVGCSLALDTFLAQSFGAGDLRAYGCWTQTGTVVLLVLCLPVMGLLASAEPLLVAFGQDELLSAGAGEFCMHLIPGIAPFFLFICLTKYLQSQGILAPVVYVGVAANIFNIFANWFFIYKMELGFKGAPIATSISRWAQLFALLGYICITKWSHPTMPSCMEAKPVEMCSRAVKFLRLGAPGALMLGLEAWSFEITTFLAAYVGTISLDAHVILLNIIGFTYMSLPFGLGIAASIRVGHLLGGGESQAAKTTSKVVFFLIFGFMISLSVLKVVLRHYVALPFTDDEAVGNKVASLVYIACLFQVSDGVQAAIGGVMRGMGHQKTVAAMNFAGFWVIGVSLGAVLTFGVSSVGVAGLWWGLAAGLTTTATIGAIILLRTDWEGEAGRAQQRVGAQKCSSTLETPKDVETVPGSRVCRDDEEQLPGTSMVVEHEHASAMSAVGV